MRAHFDVPVTVIGERPGLLRRVRDIKEAARFLLELWPTDRRGASYTVAKAACLAVLEGQCDGAAARRAFETAAKDAEIFVRATEALR